MNLNPPNGPGPIIRSLSNLATVTALLLTAATCILWSRSYHLSDRVTWTRDSGHTSLRSAQGRVVFALYQADRTGRADDVRGLKYDRDAAYPATVELLGVFFLCSDATVRLVHWDRAGFAWTHRRSSRDLIVTAVAPFWSVALATAASPLGWTTLRLRARCRARRRKNSGLCPACGYDLRATPDRCPECGAIPLRNPKADPSTSGKV